jgi:hypothetical protein
MSARSNLREQVPAPNLFGPQLVSPPRPRPIRSPLALWHLLSLDAPTVATVWTLLIARCSGLHLPWVEPAAMFVAVWIIYAADRLLDARLLDADRGPASAPDRLEERHHFHHLHRRAFLYGIAFAAFVLITLLHHTDPRALHLYALLATMLGVWMLLIHAGTRGAQRLPKEIAVGLFFPAAIFIPTVSRLPFLRAELLPSALLFAAVCSLNCLLLYGWEHPTITEQAHATTRWAANHLTALITATLTIACIATVLQHNKPGAAPALACALSVTLLWLLHHLRHRIAALHLRALADFVLLTPLLLWPFMLLLQSTHR